MNQKAQISNYILKTRDPTSPSDLDLIRQIAVQDQVALEALYDRYHLSLYNYFLKTTQDQNSAEDLLQECFLSVWEGAGKFEGRSTVKTWLFRIAFLMSAGWLRNNKVVLQDIENESIEALDDPENSSLETQVFLNWNLSQIQKAVVMLNPRQYEVIIFTFTYNLSPSEIAYIVECPVGTVKSRLYAALRQLNQILSSKGIIQ